MAFTIKKTKKQLLSKSAAHKKFHADETVLVATPSAPAIVNDLVPALVIERPPINKIKPAKKRARRASKNHLANVIKAIQSLGQVAPILIDAEGRIVGPRRFRCAQGSRRNARQCCSLRSFGRGSTQAGSDYSEQACRGQ